MVQWRKILRRFGPRADADGEFYPDKLEVEGPVLLNTMGPLAAAFVGARVLRAVAARRGTSLRPAAIEKLEKLVSRGLSTAVTHHCEAEAERVLEWLDAPPAAEDSVPATPSSTPELEMMLTADLESRLSVARLALKEDYDLELEYFDEDSEQWPRCRAQLISIDDGQAADFHTTLTLRDRRETWTVALKHVRWLMPVPATDEWADEEGSTGAEVVAFPGLGDDS